MGSYNKKDINYKVCWEIDDDRSEEFEVMKPYADIDEEKKWQTILLKDLGVKPIKVSSDSHIHILIKVMSSDYEQRRCLYGSEGYENNYQEIEGQDYDFDTKSSNYNDNGTS